MRHSIVTADGILDAHYTCRERIVDLSRLRRFPHESLDVLPDFILLSLEVGPGLLSGVQFFMRIIIDIKRSWVEDIALEAPGQGIDVSANKVAAKVSKIILKLVVEHGELFV